MDMRKVNAAVKIRIAIDRLSKKQAQLNADLFKLKMKMTSEELSEYQKRIA